MKTTKVYFIKVKYKNNSSLTIIKKQILIYYTITFYFSIKTILVLVLCISFFFLFFYSKYGTSIVIKVFSAIEKLNLKFWVLDC